MMFLKNNLEPCVIIPMRDNLRSLSLLSCAAIAVYEALRQQDFKGLKYEGKFADL